MHQTANAGLPGRPGAVCTSQLVHDAEMKARALLYEQRLSLNSKRERTTSILHRSLSLSTSQLLRGTSNCASATIPRPFDLFH